ncbi:hypothetical protein [Nocardia heshunensis]
MTMTSPKAATGEVHDLSVRSSADAVQQFARIVAGQDLLASAASQSIPGLQPISVRIQDPYAPGGDLGPIPIFPMHKDPETGQMVPGLNPADIPRPQPEPAKQPPANPQSAQQPQPNSQQPAVQSGQPQTAQPDASQQQPETVSVVPAGADEHVFGLPDVTGHKEGDTWEEVLPPTPGNPNGIRRVNTIPFGNGTQTVDQVIYNADGTITRSRVVANGLGGYQRWNNDSTGAGSYIDKRTADADSYIQSFSPGQSTSGAPSRESGTNADFSKTYQPEYDENGNYLGISLGVRNDKGLYDNQLQDQYGNTWFNRTIVNPGGGIESIQAGQVDIEGRGWWLDEKNRRWELYKDDNGNPAQRYLDPQTRGWSFIYQDGANKKNETFDASGRLLNSLTTGPAGDVIGSLERAGGLLIEGRSGKDGKLDYTFKDESNGRSRRGTLSYLPGGGMRLYYGDGYETVEYNKFGAEVKRYNRQGDRSFNEWISQEFALTALHTAGGILEGFGGITGINDVINMAGTVIGYNPHLTTKQEFLDGTSQGVDSFKRAVIFHNLTAIKELAVYKAGGQSLGDAITRSVPSYFSALNEESKLLIGTDWSGFRDSPGAVLASATIGIASWAIPTKGIRAIPGRGVLAELQTPSHLPGSSLPSERVMLLQPESYTYKPPSWVRNSPRLETPYGSVDRWSVSSAVDIGSMLGGRLSRGVRAFGRNLADDAARILDSTADVVLQADRRHQATVAANAAGSSPAAMGRWNTHSLGGGGGGGGTTPPKTIPQTSNGAARLQLPNYTRPNGVNPVPKVLDNLDRMKFVQPIDPSGKFIKFDLEPNSTYVFYDHGNLKTTIVTKADGSPKYIETWASLRIPGRKYTAYNPILDTPIPNVVYRVNKDFWLRSDKGGRIVEGYHPDIGVVSAPKRTRSTSKQGDFNQRRGTVPGTDAGHIFPVQLGSPAELVFYTPQVSSVNQGGGAIYNFERRAVQLAKSLTRPNSPGRLEWSMSMEYSEMPAKPGLAPEDGARMPFRYHAGYKPRGDRDWTERPEIDNK